MKPKKVSPYSLSVKKEGCRAFSYQVTCYPYRNVLAGGIANSARDAQRCAKQEINRLESMNQEQAA
jgi:hypothetical protein